MITEYFLRINYIDRKLSVAQIAKVTGCSEGKINYWLNKFNIKKRSLSEAQYVKLNPKGDPYDFKEPVVNAEWFLYGLGLGLWWGEGNKAAKTAVRLGNTDPDLLRYFLDFLYHTFQIDKSRLRFGLQIFTDIDPDIAQRYWCRKLNIPMNKFQKIIVTKSIKKGTYTKKSKYGVLTIYFSNTKTRDSIYDAVERLRKMTYANIAQSVERVHGGSQ